MRQEPLFESNMDREYQENRVMYDSGKGAGDKRCETHAWGGRKDLSLIVCKQGLQFC